MNRATIQNGYGFFGKVFGSVLKPVTSMLGSIILNVGADLIQGLIQDILGGKSAKCAVRSRGKQAANMALLQALAAAQQRKDAVYQ